jgi:anthranilate phosphoribosyltransferase
LKRIFEGEQSPRSDAVAFNAGAALYAADLVDSIAEGVARANALLANGAVTEILEKLKSASHQ